MEQQQPLYPAVGAPVIVTTPVQPQGLPPMSGPYPPIVPTRSDVLTGENQPLQQKEMLRWLAALLHRMLVPVGKLRLMAATSRPRPRQS
eukprot:2098184-Rhodomonas_salina.1